MGMPRILLLVAIAVCIVSIVDAACTLDELTKMSECVGKIDVLTTTDKAATCKYYGDSMACYPKCCCDDANYKTSIELVEKSLKDAGCGTIKCGSAASLS